MRLGCSMILLMLGLAAPLQAIADPARDLGGRVLKVIASSSVAGAHALGSAVVIGAETVATNCHVLRQAARVEIEYRGRRWAARLRAADADKDLCLLAVPGLPLPAVRVRTTVSLEVGERVAAVGYPAGGDLSIREGNVEALYRFQGANIIQTSASFERGASGGALFTQAGELVGLLTFKLQSGGSFHFAIPADWIAAVDASAPTDVLPDAVCAFWERTPHDRAYFLSAAWHEANREWSALYLHCLDWIQADPGSEEARRAMLRAIGQLPPR